ncbi:MAG: recombination protein RecR [Deltaproteobacteria bacterium]|nr:MAG: recombination protein RecR [Deltaproteobacteria bacterium]
MPSEPRDPFERLTDLLGRLPGIGEKSALRLALHVVTADAAYVEALAESLVAARRKLALCGRCRDLCVGELCPRCRDARRDAGVVCVVARPQDRIAMERAGVFRGVYHVLHGVLDPLGGIGPNELEIESLLRRLDPADDHAANGGTAVREVIVATSANVEGDATALYLSRLLAPLGVQVSRIASGLAVGGEVEYADASTLHRALEDRRPLPGG